MAKLRVGPVVAAAICICGMACPAWAAASPPDPTSNFVVDVECPDAASCLGQTIAYLDEARATLGQPPYALPDNFGQLSPPQQAFVLTNLDRVQYGLTPIAGLTDELDRAAFAGAQSGTDPVLADPSIVALASNWAGGYETLPLAYAGWMYADGPGGTNLDCSTAGAGGCWGHRENILQSFSGSGPLAMGAATGTTADGSPSAAMLIVQGTAEYHPTYAYTWSQALAAGADNGRRAAVRAAPSKVLTRVKITKLRVRGRAVYFRVLAPAGASLACALGRIASTRRTRLRYRVCWTGMSYRRLRRGTYRLVVRAEGRTASRDFTVR
jgi:hypothetical protein